MRLKGSFLLVFLVCALLSEATTDAWRYRVLLTDKQDSTLVGELVPALSEKALNRRALYDIPVDSTDYPLSRDYLLKLDRAGFKVVSQSRWMNSVVVSVSDSSTARVLRALPYVRSVQLVWANLSSGSDALPTLRKMPERLQTDSLAIYGSAATQTEMIGLEPLHTAGYKGEGICIAVVDCGFLNVNTMSWFKKLKLKMTKDLVYPPSSIWQENYHGTAVLSVMAADSLYTFTGTAPEADYCLLRSEEVSTEYPIEEDYWIAAVELADSLGADIVTTSLGYTLFQSPCISYTTAQLDGQTAFISQAAKKAVNKGLLLVCSAGNDGENDWKQISFPADVAGVLTVGAVNANRKYCSFSSVGPTADGRIKPDVAALGYNVPVINGSGILAVGSGTSLAAPIITGMAACLWQAFPALSAQELTRLIQNSGDNADTPDALVGYGIPNACRIWLAMNETPVRKSLPTLYSYPNPAYDRLYLVNFTESREQVTCIIRDLSGIKVMETSFSGQYHFLNVSSLPSGLYIITFLKKGIRQISQKVMIN